MFEAHLVKQVMVKDVIVRALFFKEVAIELDMLLAWIEPDKPTPSFML